MMMVRFIIFMRNRKYKLYYRKMEILSTKGFLNKFSHQTLDVYKIRKMEPNRSYQLRGFSDFRV